MAGISTRRILSKNIVIKLGSWRYITTCKRNFSSSDDKTDNASSNNKSDKKNQNQIEKEQLEQRSKIGSASKPADENKEAAKKKLFSLLSEIKVSQDNTKIKPGLTLARPLKRPTKSEQLKKLQAEKSSPETDMKNAVDIVAHSVGGDPQTTKTELSHKLSSLNLVHDMPEKDDEIAANNLDIDESMQENIMTSVKNVASTVETPIKSKLTQRLLRMSVERKTAPQTKLSIESMMKGVKIETTKTPAVTQTSDVKIKERRPSARSNVQTKVNIFQSPALDIFSPDQEETKDGTTSAIWQMLENKKLKLLTEFAPANAFEEMIMWTEQGRHWIFPIDNEIDMGEEENVSFHEHVFLEEHLLGFPTKGPIRHFMELVVVGLSKNPYITVDRKIENINWFREYFKEKEDILKEYGAI